MKKIHTGFTLVETLVVVAIVGLLSTVVIFGYRSFTERLGVKAVAQEIAVAVRQAQSYGLSVKGQGDGDFPSGYGISLDTLHPDMYSIFIDKNSNGVYDGNLHCTEGTGDCLVEQHTMRNNVIVGSLCGADASGTSCPPTAGSQAASVVSVVFVRPNPDAFIRFSNSVQVFPSQYQKVVIVLKSRTGVQSPVTIESTGQISTQ